VALDNSHPLDRLFGIQHFAGHAWAALVGTIKFTFTETALDVAAGSHRQVNPAGLAVVSAKAGVICLALDFHHRASGSHDVSP